MIEYTLQGRTIECDYCLRQYKVKPTADAYDTMKKIGWRVVSTRPAGRIACKNCLRPSKRAIVCRPAFQQNWVSFVLGFFLEILDNLPDDERTVKLARVREFIDSGGIERITRTLHALFEEQAAMVNQRFSADKDKNRPGGQMNRKRDIQREKSRVGGIEGLYGVMVSQMFGTSGATSAAFYVDFS